MSYSSGKKDWQGVFIHPKAVDRLKRCRHILDVGCDIGRLRFLFPDAELIGIDIRAEMRICLERGYKRFFAIDLDQGWIPDHVNDIYVDCVILVDVLEHLHNPLFAMENIAKICAPGAFVYCCSPTKFNLKYWDDYTHVRPFSDNMTRRLLVDSGFTELELLYIYQQPFIGFNKLFYAFLNSTRMRAYLSDRYPFFRSKAYSICLGRRS